MNPSIEDRLASVVRALTDIILPALPADANLAREQLQLSVGHLQIICGQIPGGGAFQADELVDARCLAEELLAIATGGSEVGTARTDLRKRMESSNRAEPVNQAIHALIRAAWVDGDAGFREHLPAAVIAAEEIRSAKDRRWFEPMGFDQEALG